MIKKGERYMCIENCSILDGVVEYKYIKGQKYNATGKFIALIRHYEMMGYFDKLESNPVIPNHYGGENNPFEVRKFISAHGLNFNRGSVVKYTVRAGIKDPDKEIEDLEKAIKFLQFEIEHLKEKK